MSNTPLFHAADEVKLAVDLIYLLEVNKVDPETALKALAIVKNDLQKKQKTKAQSENQSPSE